MSDDSNDPQRDDINCVLWRNENTIIRARHQGKTQNSSIMNAEDNIRNNVLSSYQSGLHRIPYHTGSNYYKQRTKYNLRETSPMSLRSVPTNLQSNYSRSQWSEMDARCQSPFSIRTTSDAPSNMSIRSAIDVVSAIKSLKLKFNRRESKMIRDAVMDNSKRKYGRIRKARRPNKKLLKSVRRQSGGDSGEQGSNSSISSDDYNSVRSARNMTSRFRYQNSDHCARSMHNFPVNYRQPQIDRTLVSEALRNNTVCADNTRKQNNLNKYISSNSHNCYNSALQYESNKYSMLQKNRYQSIATMSIPEEIYHREPPKFSHVATYKDVNNFDMDIQNSSISSDDCSSLRSAGTMTGRVSHQNSVNAKSCHNFPRINVPTRYDNTLIGGALRNNTICTDNTQKVNHHNFPALNSRRDYTSLGLDQSQKLALSAQKNLPCNQSIATISQPEEPSKNNYMSKYRNNFKMQKQPIIEFENQNKSPEKIIASSKSTNLDAHIMSLPKENNKALQLKSQKNTDTNKNNNTEFVFAKPQLPSITDRRESKFHKAPKTSHEDKNHTNIDDPTDLSNCSNDILTKSSFMRRKLFTPSLDVTENNHNNSNSGTQSPLANIYRSEPGNNKSKKYINSRSYLHRTIIDDKSKTNQESLLNLLQKIVPPNDINNITNQSKKHINQEINKEIISNAKTVSRNIVAPDSDNISETFTDDEDIFTVKMKCLGEKTMITEAGNRQDQEGPKNRLCKDNKTKNVITKSNVIIKSDVNLRKDIVKNCNTLNSTSKYNVPSHIKYPQKELSIVLHNFNPRFSNQSRLGSNNNVLKQAMKFWATDSENEADCSYSKKTTEGKSKNEGNNKRLHKRQKCSMDSGPDNRSKENCQPSNITRSSHGKSKPILHSDGVMNKEKVAKVNITTLTNCKFMLDESTQSDNNHTYFTRYRSFNTSPNSIDTKQNSFENGKKVNKKENNKKICTTEGKRKNEGNNKRLHKRQKCSMDSGPDNRSKENCQPSNITRSSHGKSKPILHSDGVMNKEKVAKVNITTLTNCKFMLDESTQSDNNHTYFTRYRSFNTSLNSIDTKQNSFENGKKVNKKENNKKICSKLPLPNKNNKSDLNKIIDTKRVSKLDGRTNTGFDSNLKSKPTLNVDKDKYRSKVIGNMTRSRLTNYYSNNDSMQSDLSEGHRTYFTRRRSKIQNVYT